MFSTSRARLRACGVAERILFIRWRIIAVRQIPVKIYHTEILPKKFCRENLNRNFESIHNLGHYPGHD
jgi:hypothetical protein